MCHQQSDGDCVQLLIERRPPASRYKRSWKLSVAAVRFRTLRMPGDLRLVFGWLVLLVLLVLLGRG